MIKVNELIALIDKLEEVEPRDNDDFKQVMGIVSGNKACLKKASLEDIVYLLNHLGTILNNELQEDYPVINLKSMPGCSIAMRRAI